MQRIKPEDLGDLYQQPWLATLATQRKDGSVLLSAMWFEWDGEAFIVSISADSIKHKHVKRNPLVSLSISEEQTHPGRGLEVVGHAVTTPDTGAAGIRHIANRYLGPELTEQWLQARADKEWLLLRIVPERIRAFDHRDEPMLKQAAPRYPSE